MDGLINKLWLWTHEAINIVLEMTDIPLSIIICCTEYVHNTHTY